MVRMAAGSRGSGGPSISFRHVDRRYGRTWALRDLSVDVPGGMVTGLVGANGAGKSTLLSLTAGLQEADAGTIEVGRTGDEPMTTNQYRAAFLSQRRPLYPNFSVGEMLRMGSKLNQLWDDSAALEWLAEHGVPTAKRCRQLSGGERAQLALWLVLARHAEITLLDEPLANLDPLARRGLLDIVRGEAKRNRSTMVISSHEVADVADTFDYLILLSHGELALAGTVPELLASHYAVDSAKSTGTSPGDAGYAVCEPTADAGSAGRVARDALDAPRPRGARAVQIGELIVAYMARAEEAHRVESRSNGGG